MPELPEVETIVRQFRGGLVGRRIVAFDSRWTRNVAPSLRAVRAGICERQIVALERRAKFIVFRLDDGGALLVHLRMSGRFEWASAGGPEPGHVRAAWRLDDGREVLFCDARKFGRIVFARDLEPLFQSLGPEPLEPAFTPQVLGDLLRRRRRRLKPLLLDQRVVAGLGNIYTDESLHAAGLHPLTLSHRLGDGDVTRLHTAIQTVLRRAIERQGTSIDWVYPGGEMQGELAVYGRDGQPCRRCGAVIVALRVGQRGTHVCPKCQPRRRTRRS